MRGGAWGADEKKCSCISHGHSHSKKVKCGLPSFRRSVAHHWQEGCKSNLTNHWRTRDLLQSSWLYLCWPEGRKQFIISINHMWALRWCGLQQRASYTHIGIPAKWETSLRSRETCKTVASSNHVGRGPALLGQQQSVVSGFLMLGRW